MHTTHTDTDRDRQTSVIVSKQELSERIEGRKRSSRKEAKEREAEKDGRQTNIMGLIKHNDTLPRELPRDLIGDFGVEEVMEGVDYHVYEGHLHTKERKGKEGKGRIEVDSQLVDQNRTKE